MDSGVRNRKVVVQFPSHPDFVHVSLDMLVHNRTNSLHAGTKCRQKMLQEFLVGKVRQLSVFRACSPMRSRRPPNLCQTEQCKLYIYMSAYLLDLSITCENMWQIISRMLVKISREVSDDLHKSLCGRICQMTCRIVCNIEMCWIENQTTGQFPSQKVPAHMPKCFRGGDTAADSKIFRRGKYNIVPWDK